MNFSEFSPGSREPRETELRDTESCQWGCVVEPWEAQDADDSDLVDTSQLSPDSKKISVFLLL